MKQFANTSTLLRFTLKRDRLFLSLWIIGIVAFSLFCAPLFTEVAKSPAELAVYAETMKNPAMVALCGPVYAEPYTYGVMYTQLMVVWILVLIGIMNIFIVARYTRKDEEEGRLELMRSLPVGRLAIISSTWIIAILANFLIAFTSAMGLVLFGIESMTMAGCLLLGGVFFLVGIFFAAVSMLLSQLCATSRGMTGGSFLVLGVFYLIAAIGNVFDNILAYFSPFSIVFKLSPFVRNHIFPLSIVLIGALITAIIAVHFNVKRDLGAGLLPHRHGRAHAQAFLSSPFGLAFRLMKKQIISWLIIIFILGVLYGAVFGDFEAFISQNEMLQMILATDAGENMILSFMTYVILIMSLITSIPVINCVLKLRTEEKKNRLESIYACSISKTEQFSAYIIIAIILSVLLQVVLSFGIWLSASVVMEETIPFIDVMITGLVKLPGIWMFAGISALLIGLLPKLTALVWAYFGLSFFVIYMGRLMDIPDVFINLSAFGLLPNYPIDEFRVFPFLAITVIAVILFIIGVTSYKERDIVFN